MSDFLLSVLVIVAGLALVYWMYGRRTMSKNELNSALLVLSKQWESLRHEMWESVERIHADIRSLSRSHYRYLDLTKRIQDIEHGMERIDENWRKTIRADEEV